ncbi:MAG: hypothetical protein DRJ42_23280 [Deltaproteobacteria bacterium]|nr:MAG: hypothetical protein DRJ42_23280 [Deltaproteobacteria bacterium]
MTKTMKRMVSGAGGVGTLLGLMSVVVGSLTLLGVKEHGYLVLGWLVAYNVALGVLSVVVGGGILKRCWWSPKAAAAIFTSHFAVLGVVIALWASSAAAPESVRSMVFRSVLWAVIAVVVWKGIGTKTREPEPA